jgi:pimeloyl-ACP methyl ester carboxylesterase
MQREVCTDFRGCHFVEGAGHWVQQEQPQRLGALLLDFLGTIPAAAVRGKSFP